MCKLSKFPVAAFEIGILGLPFLSLSSSLPYEIPQKCGNM